ncbi:MAG: hypothetical protein CL783_00445 [Chloroflexi bacterium]|nr:hypothetical protein [Chloroflexota bacterium]
MELISQKEWCDVEQADDRYGSRYNYPDGGCGKGLGFREVNKQLSGMMECGILPPFVLTRGSFQIGRELVIL